MKWIAGWLSVAALAATVAQAQTAPRLEHGAPWLGQSLELTLLDAPAFAAVRWLESDARGALPTAYGLFELERASTRVVATGTTGASGRLDLALDVPLDATLAETEAHYQALVADPAAPAGWVLSEAAHLRRVGPRLYASSKGIAASEPDPAPGGLAIVSAVTRATVATLDYGLPPATYPTPSAYQALPVFSHDLARGAVVTPAGELRVFDPFFGEPLHAQPLQQPSRQLAVTAGGTVAIALEPGTDGGGVPFAVARLLAFELETGQPLGSLELPRAASARWHWSPERDEAYLVELATESGPFFVRRVGLATLEDRGAVALSADGRHRVRDMTSAGDALLLSTLDTDDCITGVADGWLTRIDYSAQPPLVQEASNVSATSGLRPIAALGRLYSVRTGMICWGPGYGLHESRLTDPGPSRVFQPPVGAGENVPPEVEWDGARLWMPYPRDTDGAWCLLWFDVASEQFTKLTHPYGSGPLQVELIRDALVDTAAVLSIDNLPEFPLVESRVHFRDVATGALEEHVLLRPRAESLLGVPLP